jgi:DNA replication protein DnaC
MNRGFEVYSIHHDSQAAALKKAVDYVEAFPDVKRGLLFVGPCGVGKTHLSVAMMRQIIQERMATARFIDEAELLRQLHYSYGPDSTATEKEVLSPLMNVDLLIWDDLGTGRPTDWVQETIRTVINHRYTYEKQTIITSNWPLRGPSRGSSSSRVDQTLEERIGTRLFSRIMEMCEVIEIKGPDARTEIHKAGMDFQKGRPRKVFKIPPSLVECPNCGQAKITVQDQSALKRSKGRSFVELACLCGSCASPFVAHFFPKTARIEYPS